MNNPIVRTSGELVDLGKLLQGSWSLFQSKPVEHLVAGLIVITGSVLSIGVLSGPLSVGHIRMVEMQQRGEPIRIQDVFAGFDSFGSAFLTSFILFVAVCIGMILLVLPGLLLGLAWGFAIWFVALEDASTTSALGGSWQLLKSHTASVIVVFVLLAVVNLAASTVVLATLLTGPLSIIFCTLAYQEMVGESRRVGALPRG